MAAAKSAATHVAAAMASPSAAAALRECRGRCREQHSRTPNNCEHV